MEAGDLLREHHGLYRVAGTPFTAVLAMRAAGLLFEAVGSLGGAASLLGLKGFGVIRPEVTVTGNFSSRKLVMLGRSVTVHRTNLLPAHHTVVVGGLLVTTASRTLCDLSQRYDAGALGDRLDDAVRRNIVSYEEVAACRNDLRARGRRRTTVIDEVLEVRGLGFDPAESKPELRVRTWLEDAGMPPETQVRVRIAGEERRLDLAYGLAKTSCDGCVSLSNSAGPILHFTDLLTWARDGRAPMSESQVGGQVGLGEEGS